MEIILVMEQCLEVIGPVPYHLGRSAAALLDFRGQACGSAPDSFPPCRTGEFLLCCEETEGKGVPGVIGPVTYHLGRGAFPQ